VRWVLLFFAFALAGCSRNTFEVDDPKGLVRSATLRLCGSETPLERVGKSLKLSRSINCEGDGEVTLIYHDRGPEHCVVGYVTTDMPQDFHYRAEQSSCQPVSEAAR
jgi:hypothetical protein